MSDGSLQTKLFSGPVSFRDQGGAWHDISAALVPGDSLGDVVAADLATPERFGSLNSNKPSAQISSDEWSVGLDLVGAADNGHVALGDTIHYPGVATDTELQYQSSPSGIKDTLVLYSANAPTSFTFFVHLGKLQAQAMPGAGVGLFGPNADDPSLRLGNLHVFDSSPSGGPVAVCTGAQTSIQPAPGGLFVTYSVPAGWLQSPERVFPVKVDPSLNLATITDTYIHSISNLGEQDYNDVLFSGYNPTDPESSGESYGLMCFDTAPIQGAVVDSATLQLTAIAGTTGTGQVLARNTQLWSHSIIYSDGIPTSSYLASAALPASGVIQFDVTSTARDWARGFGSDPIDGFQLYAPVLGDTTTWKKYASSERYIPSQRPVLTVSYTAPSATTATTVTATGLSWFTGAGAPDNQASAGRGQVTLTWPAVTKAAGYKIMAFDGSAYRQVASVLGSQTTTWTSAASSPFPPDSTIASMPANNTSNAFLTAASPGSGAYLSNTTVRSSLTTGTGIVLTDGSYLYVIRYLWTGGPTQWRKIGTGFGGTTAGQDYGTVGPDLSGAWANSAILVNGKLYDGFTNSPGQLQGYSTNATSGTSPTYWNFSKPFVDFETGADRTGWYSGNVMLASDSGHVYSAAMSLNSGNSYDGFRVRVYDSSGNWIADHDIPMKSYPITGFFSDGQALYFEATYGGSAALVTKVRASDFTVINQFTMDVDNGGGPGTYDPTNNLFWFGSEWGPSIYAYQGPGFDLRDDPRALYTKMSSSATMSTDPRYYFKVVPYNADALADINSCPTATVELPKRSVAPGDDPRHTTFDLGRVGTADAQAQLDSGNLTLSKTDLDINSYGPDASLSRSYNSANTAVGYFGPGWRFNFERSLSIDTTGVTYLDETKDAHRFVKSGPVYLSPPGDYESLVSTSVSTPNGTAAYELLHDDKRSYELFSSTGVLLREVDKNNNSVDYRITGPEVDITAANGNQIVLALQGGGQATATYAVGTVTRKVVYGYSGNSTAATGTAAYSFSDTATSAVTPGYTLTYVYTNARVSRVTESQAATIANQPTGTSATWDLGFAASRLSTATIATLTEPFYNATQRAVVTATYTADVSGLAKASILTSGEVGGATGTVIQDFGINPSGTTAYTTNPYVSGTPPTSSSEYSVNEDELWSQDANGAAKSRTYDPSGNMLSETDEVGRITTHTYDGLNDEVSSVNPARSLTSKSYDPYGNESIETKTLTATSTACTQYTYDANGRQTLERQELFVDTGGTSHWATTVSTYGSPFNDPTKVDHYGETSTNGTTFSPENIDLGTGVANGVAQLEDQATFDGFGKKLTTKDANQQTTAIVYDSAGRLLSSTDSLGLATVSVYDGLGRAVGAYKQAGASVIGYTTNSIDPFDRAIVASTWRTNGATSTAVLDHTDTTTYDAMGKVRTIANSLVSGQPEVQNHDTQGNVTSDWAAGLSSTQTANTGYASRGAIDAAGQQVSQSDPGTMTAATTTTYTLDGNASVVTNPDKTTVTLGYDAAGNNASQTVSGAGSVVTTFDAGGRATVSTDTGLATTFTYDLASRQTGAQAAGRQVSSTTYNSQGWVLSTTDADGIVTANVYDMCGRLVSRTWAAQGSQPKTTVSAYDADSRLLSSTDPDGRILTDHYDPFGRLDEQTQKASSSGLTLKDLVTSYDSLSRVQCTTDTVSQMATGWTYPVAWGGQTRTAVRVVGVTTTSTVDAAGNELNRATAGTGFASFTRSVTGTDSAGRVNAWTLGVSNGTYGFDQAGRESTQTGPGFGTSAALYQYDTTTGHEVSMSLPFASPFGSDTEQYSYDSNGRLTTATASGAFDGSFMYDAAGDVTTFTAPTDLAGHATIGTLEYDAATGRLSDLRVSGSVATVYGFDSHGWRTSQGPQSNPSAVVLSYTGQGGLKSYDTSAGVHATYAFDALGQRIGSVVTSGSVTTTTSYTYDGITLRSLSATSSSAGTATSIWSITYCYDGTGHPYAGIYSANNSTTTVFEMTTNNRGDVVALTDTTGTPFAIYRYDAWGRALAVTTQTVGATRVADITARQPLRYAGYVYDSESGFYYCSARTYDPATMQFLQKDRAKADAEESAYQYCGGDPVRRTDPSGLMWMEFNGHELIGHRYLGRWGGKNHYKVVFDFRATTADLSQPFSANGNTYGTAGPIPPGNWYFLQREWTKMTWAREQKIKWTTPENPAGYAPRGGYYVPLHPSKGTQMFGRPTTGWYLHSYDPKRWAFQQTLGCIRIDPGNMEAVRAEGARDSNGRIPLYVRYSEETLRSR